MKSLRFLQVQQRRAARALEKLKDKLQVTWYHRHSMIVLLFPFLLFIVCFVVECCVVASGVSCIPEISFLAMSSAFVVETSFPLVSCAPVLEMKFHISSPSFCLDMSLAKGEIDVDQSPLTGESELVTKSTAEGRGEVFTTTDFLVQRGL